MLFETLCLFKYRYLVLYSSFSNIAQIFFGCVIFSFPFSSKLNPFDFFFYVSFSNFPFDFFFWPLGCIGGVFQGIKFQNICGFSRNLSVY